MSTFLQTCPDCSRSLELPAEARGRLAKCPACEATFRADLVEATDQGTLASGRPQIIQLSIEDILSPTLAIFRVHWKPSVISCLIIAAASVVLIGIPAWVLWTLSSGGQRWVAVIGVMLMVPYSLLLGAYALVGLSRVHLAIARGEPDVLEQLKPSTDRVLRFLPSYLLMFLAIALVFGIGISLVLVTAVSGQPHLSKLVGIVVAFAIMVVVTVLQWYFWAWMMAASDGKCTVLGSLKVAASITMRNRLCSFFIVIIAVVLSLVGSLMCYVGHIVTSPLTLLLFAVGYLLITDQSIADPAEETA